MALVKRTNRNLNNQLIGDGFDNIPSNTVFSLGDFRVESNFTGRVTKDYSNELSSFVKPITLETIGIDQSQSQKFAFSVENATLNLDRTDLRSFAKFGSTSEIIRVALQNIIIKYPASLFVSDQVNVGGNITLLNYLYDVDNDTSTFDIPSQFIINKFALTFNNGNNEIIDGNSLRNLNLSYYKYVIWRKDKSKINNYDILDFVGDNDTNPFVSVLVKGNPFPEASGGTTNLPYHLKPNPQEFNSFKSKLSQLESYIVKERISDNSGFKSIFKNIIPYDTGVQFIDKIYVWPTTDAYNPDFNNSLFDAFKTALINLGINYDDLKTDLIYRFLTPESLKMFDNTDEGKLSKMLRIYGREFDNTRIFIDSLVNVNKVSYDKKNNLPDQLVKNLAKALGWDVFALLEEEQFVDEITALNDIEQEEGNLLPAEIDIELWRRILINTNYYWKSKGTRHALKSILLLIGIPEPFVNITEYVYTVDGKINPDEVTLTLADLPSASLPYDVNGYPIAVAETDDMFFQLSGNSDSGQAYIDLYRAVGFDVNRTVDNKKSWIETGYIERSHSTTPNYIQNDSKLIINTKEIDVTLDTARAIEYDVWRYITEIDFPINSSGYTKPYTFVNVGIGYESGADSFSIPHEPLGNIQLNFNGVALSPSGSTEISSGNTSWDYSQSGKTVTINPLAGITAKHYPSGNKDIITLTYLYDRLGIPTIGEIKYLVYRINPSTEITNAGARIHLPEEPNGDVQLSINGVSVAQGGTSFIGIGDYVKDPTNPKVLVIQNADLILFLTSNPWVMVSFIVNSTEITIEKKSEFYRVDSLNSDKIYFCAPVNKVVYRLNFAMIDVEDIKLMVNGITLQPHTDYQLNPNNPYEIYLPPNINLGDVIGAYYLIDPTNTSTPIISDIFGIDVGGLTFLEFVELVQRRLVNAKSRKIITDFNGGYYPTLLSLYVEYLRRACLDDDNPLKTNGYTFGNLYPFISKYNAFFERFVKQLLPATIILRKGGILIRNTIFTKQKFTYKRGVSFDPELNWMGTDGSEFKYRLPETICDWTDDFVCIGDSCDGFEFVDDPIVICNSTTTTTTTTLPINGVVFAIADESTEDVYVTKDSAENFNATSIPDVANISDIDFGFDNVGYVVGTNVNSLGYFGRGVYDLSSNDITWVNKSGNIPGSFSVGFIEGVGRYSKIFEDAVIIQSASGDIGITVNGGNSIIEGSYFVQAPNSASVGGVCLNEYTGGGAESVGGLVNSRGFYFKRSSDLGWTNSTYNPEFPSATDRVYNFSFQSATNGFSVRKKSGSGVQPFTIEKTIDAGINWTILYDSTPNTNYRVNGSGSSPITVDMLSSTIGWVSAGLSNGDGALFSVNGTNWLDVTSNLPSGFIVHMIAFDENTVYISISGDGIYETTNAGSSWTKKSDLYGRMSKIGDNR